MGWMIPIVAGQRKRSRSSVGGLIAGLFIFLIIGVFFFIFFNRTGIFSFGFPMIFIMVGFIVFIMVISGIAIAASSMSKSYKPQKVNCCGQSQTFNQKQVSQQNPYVVQEPIQKQIEPLSKEKPAEVVPVVNEINFCRYCGAKLDREARFCQQCGSKL
ncbi:MAG: zinc-ribbon domain-containing protein [Promethearchaeota archaeon]|jgi:ribosomal protein L40E